MLRNSFWVIVAVVALVIGCRGGGGGETPTPMATGSGPGLTPTPSATASIPEATPPPPTRQATGEGAEPVGRIVFLSWRDGNREIYSINVDGSDPKNLTDDPGVDENPDVSPDGKQIVWVSDRDGGDIDLYVMDIDGSNVRQLADGGQSPRWSHDGKRIVYGRGGDLMVIDVEGGTSQVIMEAESQETAAPCRAGAFPGGWSPDDSRISYYSVSVTRGIGQVCTMDPDGSNITVVVGEPPVYNVEPTWSLDGRYLAFRSIRDGNHDVYTYDFETDTVRRPTDDPDIDIEPNWSPDGEWIVFGSGRDNVFVDLYIMRKDGSDVRQVTKHPKKDSEPSWVP